MRQLVGEQALALLGVGSIVAGAEDHMMANGECLGADAASEFVRLYIVVDAYSGEIGVEARLHVGSYLHGQCAAACRQCCNRALGCSIDLCPGPVCGAVQLSTLTADTLYLR